MIWLIQFFFVAFQVEWSDQYIFNVHARSVYPCDGSSGGISVLFEYPACRLEGDRVRVYGHLRADVASLAPPSSRNYVAELKAPPGKHTLTFDCDIFTEKFVEYCFVYVTQAITNATAEVRDDCIPTFPVQGMFRCMIYIRLIPQYLCSRYAIFLSSIRFWIWIRTLLL